MKPYKPTIWLANVLWGKQHTDVGVMGHVILLDQDYASVVDSPHLACKDFCKKAHSETLYGHG